MKTVKVPETFNDCVALELCAARERAGFNQTELAEASGVSQPVISRWETGRVPITIVTLRQLCAVLDVTVVEIIKRAEVRAKELGIME